MDSIQTTLQNKFATPLPDFYKRRIVFWHDSEGEFADSVEENVTDSVKFLKLTGSNWFPAKKLLYPNGFVEGLAVNLHLR